MWGGCALDATKFRLELPQGILRRRQKGTLLTPRERYLFLYKARRRNIRRKDKARTDIQSAISIRAFPLDSTFPRSSYFRGQEPSERLPEENLRPASCSSTRDPACFRLILRSENVHHRLEPPLVLNRELKVLYRLDTSFTECRVVAGEVESA